MTTAPTRRRRAAALGVVALVASLSALLLPRLASAQQCPPLDLDCVPTTTEATTTTVDDTTTTEDTEPEETTTTEGRTRDEPREPEVVETTAVTITVTTLRDVLIPGDGTEGAETTTTTEPELATADGGISDETLILVIVAGLTLVAVVVGVLTWRYWAATRPTVGSR